MAGHTEHAFESAIEHGLITSDRYERRASGAYDPDPALFPEDVIGFLHDSQRDRWAQLEAMLKDHTAATVIDSLSKESAARYAANRLTITRQLGFVSNVLKRPDGAPRTCVIDVVLSLNGLPVVTVELKNPLTGQRAKMPASST